MKINNFMSGPLAVNCYLVEDEGTKKAFIIDPGGHNIDMVNHINVNGLEVDYIILTHGHGDHIGGVNSYLEEYPKAKLIAGEYEKELLENPKLNFSKETCGYLVSLVADQYVIDGETMKIGNMELHFIHTPGHTPGGICIFVGDVLFSGDTLFAQSIGRTDFPGSSFADIKDSIRNKLYKLPDDTQVLPGHMGPSTIGFEKENNPFV